MAREMLFLIDGANYAYRAFYAIRELTNSQGFPTNAIYGFTKMLFKILRDFSPTHLAVVFDAKGPTFRHDLYDEYKANRKATPANLIVQLPAIKELIRTLGITVIEHAGVEADDIIGSLACRWAAQDKDVVIVSGDKDFMQLVGDNIVLLDTMKDVRYDAMGVKEFLGVAPCFVVDLFALVGDSSDNIPGVAGIGKKSAQALVEQFGNIENIVANIDKITNARVKESIRQNLALLRLSYDLARIRTDVEEPGEIEILRRQAVAHNTLLKLLQLYEFGSLLQEVKLEKHSETTVPHLTVGREITLAALVERLYQSASFALMLPTRQSPLSEHDVRNAIAGVALAITAAESYYVPFALLNGEEGAALRTALADPALGKIVHNYKAIANVFAGYGIELAGLAFDTMLAAYLLNSAQRSYDIKDIALEYLGQALPLTSANTEGKEALVVTEQARALLNMRKNMEEKLAANQLGDLLREVEMPLAGVLGKVERRGVLVDGGLLREMSKEMEALLAIQEKTIYTLAGERFNINSPKQLQVILFEKMHLPKGRKTKEGYSTDNEVLSNLAINHELPAAILAYRSLAKLQSTYIDALPKMINPHTGRIHTSFNQTGTATGRLSSSNPNLQNIPIRTPFGRRIRQAFVVPAGWRLLCADYSQIELRILAHLSGDKLLQEAFSQGDDVHSSTAIALFNVFPTMLTEDMRRFAKVINFGIIYGMSAFGLAKELGLDQKTAQRYIDDYFFKHDGVRRYLDAVIDRAKNDGFVTTIFKRRRYLPEMASDNKHIRQFAERAAINTTVQGSAADIIKMAMLRVQQRLEQEGLAARMILQVHDELIFECPADEVASLTSLLLTEMEGVASLSAPLQVNIAAGANWDEAH